MTSHVLNLRHEQTGNDCTNRVFPFCVSYFLVACVREVENVTLSVDYNNSIHHQGDRYEKRDWITGEYNEPIPRKAITNNPSRQHCPDGPV
jgi:hypothetical protein